MRHVFGVRLFDELQFRKIARMSVHRPDGVRITHDPYAPGMAEKYGAPGYTDQDGFDPYADTVGPGIYGGNVKRDGFGNVLIGEQYQGHNAKPGPVYEGTGYSKMSEAIRHSVQVVEALLEKDPKLVNEVTTGGATPLHMCGMSSKGQKMTAFLISRGAQIEAVDTYGMRPLHRMASNNLAIGASALLEAGADVQATVSGMNARTIAEQADAYDVIRVIDAFA